MGVVLATRNIDSFSVPRFKMVPFLIAGSRYVVRARSAPYISAPQTDAAAVAPRVGRGAAALLGAVAAAVTAAAAGETVQTRHRLAGAIVVKLQSLSDFCHQRVHFFGIHGDGLL